MRLNDQGNKALQSRISEALNQNMNLIEQLKNKICDLESHNFKISRQNDDVRSGALDAIHGARDLEALQTDIDRINFDLSEKADTIGRLIEDN